MAHVELEDGGIRIASEFREKELVKQVPGSRWDNPARVWRASLSWATCVALRGVFGQTLTVGPELAAWARAEVAARIKPALELRASLDAPGREELYPFQRAGVAFLRVAGSALLADEMGTGKTIQAIQALTELDAWPALIVCPNTMKRTWACELATWAPNVTSLILDGGVAARRRVLAELKELTREHEVAVIVNWESLRLHTRLAGYGSIRLTDEEREERELNRINWLAVVADEAHRAKDPRAKQTRALWGVSRDVSHRFALTGTPVANNPLDLWSIMHFVSPDEWSSRTRWVDRYGLQSWNNFGGMDVVGLRSETRDELFSFLDPRFIRRPKAAVLPQLPPKTYVKRHVELGAKQLRAYKQIRDELLVELESGVLIASHPLQRLTRLIQFASAHGVIEADGSLKLAEPSCKVDALEEVVEELGGRAAIVFAESRQLIELAAARMHKLGYRCAQVTGAVSTDDRQANVEAFQAGDLQLILCTLGAGGEGLTLTAADTSIFLQRSFSAVRNSQAEDRNHRIGQDRPVTVVDVIAVDTIEERVHALMLDKAARLEEVARDADTIRRWLT